MLPNHLPAHREPRWPPAVVLARFVLAGCLFATPAVKSEAAEISGVYAGNYVCGQQTFPLRLTISSQPDGTLAGVFAFQPVGGAPRGLVETAYSLRGRYTPGTGHFQLLPGRWVGRPPIGYSMVGIDGTYDAAADTLRATISDRRCGAVDVKRDASQTALFQQKTEAQAEEMRNVPSSSAASGKPPESCLAIIRWSSRFEQEYSGTNWRNTPVDMLGPKFINLFEDDYFVPYFGKPYDQMSQTERMQIGRGAMRECAISPPFRPRFQAGLLSLLERPFLLPAGGLSEASANRVMERRRVRQEYRQTVDQLKALTAAADSYPKALTMEGRGRAAYTVLWPSEYKNFETTVDQTKRRTAEPLLVARVGAAIAGAQNREGFLKLDQVAAENRELFSAVGPEVAKRENERLAAASRQGLQRLMVDERKRVDAIGAGLAGLEEGARWYRDFNANYQKALTEESVRATLIHFTERREHDLRANSAPLEAAIRKTAGGGELDAVLARYTAPSDRSGSAGAPTFAVVAEQQKKFTDQALAKLSEAERKRDVQTSRPQTPLNAGISLEGYNVPGIFGAVYAGRFELVGDDTNTRDYLLSVKREINRRCQGLANSGTVALVNYAMYYESKSLKTGLQSAISGDYDKSLRALLDAGHGGLGRASGIAATTEHLFQEGIDDAASFFLPPYNYKCDSAETRQLNDNMRDLAIDRGTIPPDIADDSRFLAQLSPKLKQKFAASRSTENPMLARSLKKACGVYVQGAAIPRAAEGFCRCQVKMMLESQIPRSSLDLLLPANITRASLQQLDERYPEYKRLSKQCYN